MNGRYEVIAMLEGGSSQLYDSSFPRTLSVETVPVNSEE
jgi:hypothetical protein